MNIDEQLARAEALAADGHKLDAIDLLAGVFRESHDHRAACRLVDLRHTAFAELEGSPGRPVWPAPFADPFPGREGIVEARPDELSGDLIGGAITHHGCFRVNGFLDGETVDRLRGYIDRAFEARERAAEPDAVESGAPWFVPYEAGRARAEGMGRDVFVRVIDSPDVLCELVDLYDAIGLSRAVREYLGERPAMIANKWILRRSPTGVLLGDFHQDGAFLGEGIRTVDCWIALSECGPGTGRPAIDLVAERVDGILPTGNGSAYPWGLAEQTLSEALPDSPVLSPVFAPGDALFFDERLPHRTSVGTDLGPRYAIESWFVAPSSYPDRHVPVVL